MNISTVKLFVLFIGVLLLFAFLARVIYIHNLPLVVVDSARPGTIRHHHRAHGTVRVTDFNEIIAHETGWVTLHVSEGDTITEGQLIYSIAVDIRALEDRLRALEHNRNAQTVQILRLQGDISARQTVGVRPPVRAPLNLFELDLEIENLNTRIRNARTEAERLRTLYLAGAVPRANLYGIEREIETLNDLLDAALSRRQNAIDRYEEDRAQDTEIHEDALANNARILADLNFQLQASRLALEAIEDEIYVLNSQVHMDGVYEHHSASAGEIILIHETARHGRRVTENTPLMTLRPYDSELYAVFTLPYTGGFAGFLEIGQRAGLNIRNRRNLAGTIENIIFLPAHFEVHVSFDFPGIQIGERVETVFESVSSVYPRVLPNSAIRQSWWEEGRHLVLLVERERVLFGYVYTVRHQIITVQEEGPAFTAIGDGFPGDLDVVIGSSQPITTGSRVRITPVLP